MTTLKDIDGAIDDVRSYLRSRGDDSSLVNDSN